MLHLQFYECSFKNTLFLKTPPHAYVSPPKQLIGLQNEWLVMQFGWNNILIACGSEG